MLSVPSATFSINSLVHSIGNDAGFVAILGIALLAILYFAHARETSNLRDALDDAHDRISSLEQRVLQLIQQQQQVRQQPTGAQPTVAPRPAVKPMGSAVAAMRQTPAATALVALPAMVGARPGLGAPSLGSATKLIPDPPRPAPAPLRPALPAAAAIAAASAATVAGDTNAGQTAVLVGPPAAANGAGAGNQAAVPPRVQIRPAANPAPSPNPVPRRTAPAPQPRGIEEPRRSLLRRLAPALVGVVIIVAVVLVLLHLTASPASKPTSHHGAATTHTNTKGSHHGPPKLDPAKYRVAVLNGTAVNGLAAQVSTVVTNHGFKPGTITNAASQTENETVVYYQHASDKAAAERVAAVLKLPASRVQVASPTVLESCATSTSGSTSTCNSSVIVSVGADKANLASAGSSSG